MVDDVLSSLATKSTRRQDGFFFTGRQFFRLVAWVVGATVTTQLAVNLFALDSFITRKANAAVMSHNADATAHVLTLLEEARQETLLEGRLVAIETRLKNIEEGVDELRQAHNGKGPAR